MGYTIFHAGDLEWHPRREGDPRLVSELSEAMTSAGKNATLQYLAQLGIREIQPR